MFLIIHPEYLVCVNVHMVYMRSLVTLESKYTKDNILPIKLHGTLSSAAGTERGLTLGFFGPIFFELHNPAGLWLC